MPGQTPTVRMVVGAVKTSVPLRASTLGLAAFPLDGPAPEVRLQVALETGETLSATVGGKAFRRIARALTPRLALGDDPVVVLQGSLQPGNVLGGAGFIPPAPATPAAKPGAAD